MPDHQIVLEEVTASKLNQNRRFFEAYAKYHIRLYAELHAQRTLHKETILASLRSADRESLDLHNYVRLVPLKYANEPVSPKGSITLQGGRFNVGRGVNPEITSNYALYIADTEETAYNERYQAPKTQSALTTEELYLTTRDESYAYVKLTGTVSGLLNLSIAQNFADFLDVIAKFEISRDCRTLAKKVGLERWNVVSIYDDLINMCLRVNWRLHPMLLAIPATSQIFGNLVREAGFSGIIYKSTVHQGTCIAFFPENFADDSSVCAKSPADGTQHPCLTAENWQQLVK